MTRVVLLTLLFGAGAFAQTDDWNTFPPAPQPQPQTQPQSQPPPAPAKAAEPAPKKVDPEARKRVEERVQKAQAKPLAASGTDAVVSTQERYLPGSEPHSPATWGNAVDAKTNLRIAPANGGIGLLHVGSADLGREGILRFWTYGEYHNLRDFPVLEARNIRSAGTFGASFVPLEWLEVWASYAAWANTNSRSSPNLIQALGDGALGVKASRRWAEGFFAGAELRFFTFSGVGNQGVDRWAAGFGPRLVATYDVREKAPKVPLRAHFNVGLMLDGTGSLVRNHRLNSAEQYALGINEFHRFTVGLALEAPLPLVTPFVEYNLGVPLGVPNGELRMPNGQMAPVAQVMPQTLSVGLKVTAVKDLTVSVAADFGLTRRVGQGVAATPPFNFLFGAAFNIDPFQRGETRLVETVLERKVETPTPEVPKTAKVTGRVLDKETQKPIPGVIIAMAGANLPPVASDASTGMFLTHELPGGKVKLVAHKEGYKAAEQEVEITPGKMATVDLALESEPRKAIFELTVKSKKKPVAATVTFEGPLPHTANVAAAAEPTAVELPAGRYVVNVTAEGYLAQTRDVQTVEGAKMPLQFDLVPEPKKKLVVVKENKIEILQQVHFATGKATILADSFILLQQVVDAIVKNNIKRIRVEGHTDNRGKKATNQKLSEARAAAVADYLVSQGIDRSRIESAGYGDSRPLAPNLTARGRELNRRVEFVILER